MPNNNTNNLVDLLCIEFVIKYQDFIDVPVRSFEHFVQSFRQKLRESEIK